MLRRNSISGDVLIYFKKKIPLILFYQFRELEKLTEINLLLHRLGTHSLSQSDMLIMAQENYIRNEDAGRKSINYTSSYLGIRYYITEVVVIYQDFLSRQEQLWVTINYQYDAFLMGELPKVLPSSKCSFLFADNLEERLHHNHPFFFNSKCLFYH